MKRRGAWAGLIFLVCLGSDCRHLGTPFEQAKLEAFTSKEGRFTAKMPGQPAKQTQSMPLVGELTLYSVEGASGMYGVGYGDLPNLGGRESAKVIGQRLDAGVQGSVRNINATLKKQLPVYLAGKYPGREFEATLPNGRGLIRSRIYFVGKRYYQIMVLGKPELVNSKNADEFLRSFQVTAR
jgi:hypothetical protein